MPAMREPATRATLTLAAVLARTHSRKPGVFSGLQGFSYGASMGANLTVCFQQALELGEPLQLPSELFPS